MRPHHRLASARGRDPQRIPMGLQGRMTAVAEGHLTVAQLHRSDRATTAARSEEHTSELQSLMRISYAVFCLKKITLIHISEPTDKPHICYCVFVSAPKLRRDKQT